MKHIQPGLEVEGLEREDGATRGTFPKGKKEEMIVIEVGRVGVAVTFPMRPEAPTRPMSDDIRPSSPIRTEVPLRGKLEFFILNIFVGGEAITIMFVPSGRHGLQIIRRNNSLKVRHTSSDECHLTNARQNRRREIINHFVV
jgi:hypothetical protein